MHRIPHLMLNYILHLIKHSSQVQDQGVTWDIPTSQNTAVIHPSTSSARQHKQHSSTLPLPLSRYFKQDAIKVCCFNLDGKYALPRVWGRKMTQPPLSSVNSAFPFYSPMPHNMELCTAASWARSTPTTVAIKAPVTRHMQIVTSSTTTKNVQVEK